MADLTHQKEQRPNKSSPAKSRTSIELKWRGLAVFAASPLLVGVQTQAHGLLSFTRLRYVQWIHRLNKQKFQVSSSSLPSYAKLRIPFHDPLRGSGCQSSKQKTIWTHLQQVISQVMFLTKNLRCIWGTPSYEAVGCKKPDETHETSLKAKCLSFACLFSCQQFGYIRIYPEKNEFNLYDLYIKSRRYTFHSLF